MCLGLRLHGTATAWAVEMIQRMGLREQFILPPTVRWLGSIPGRACVIARDGSRRGLRTWRTCPPPSGEHPETAYVRTLLSGFKLQGSRTAGYMAMDA